MLSINGMRVTSHEQGAKLVQSVEGEVKVRVTRLVFQQLLVFKGARLIPLNCPRAGYVSQEAARVRESDHQGEEPSFLSQTRGKPGPQKLPTLVFYPGTNHGAVLATTTL